MTSDRVTGAAACRLDDAALLAQCTVSWFRSSGPGGQHANKTDSAVRIVHRTSGATVQCQDHRQRERNIAEALIRLRLRLACTQRGGSDPAWLDPYRRGRQLTLGANARDYPAAVACALDALAAARGSLAEAGAALGISTSQLARLLCADGEVRAAANALRAEHGAGPLHD